MHQKPYKKQSPAHLETVWKPARSGTVRAQAQEIKRLALLGTMAAVFAHEVGNPLAGILLSLKCVESQLKNRRSMIPL